MTGLLDVHAHFTPPTTARERQARWQAMRAKRFLAPQPYHWTVAGTLDYMDRAGVAMQLLSNIPKTPDALRESNDYGAALVAAHPTRFGLLAALPTDDPRAALAEIARCADELHVDGFAVTCDYNGVSLGDPSLEPVWAELDRRGATVFAHPDAYAPANLGRPSPLLEVAFETARTVVDLLYAGILRRFPNFRLILAHCGGALPALAGRLELLGTQDWVPNPNRIEQHEIRAQLAGLYLDTAATGTGHSLAPALAMTSPEHLVYGSDSGVPCSTETTLEANRQALADFTGLPREQRAAIGHNALRLFPAAVARIDRAPGADQDPKGTGKCSAQIRRDSSSG
ncbi:amidohydrolase family protein [Sciscionella marina]|uniref:amidohydrolase family protein n=1 Tax=Sciscionella marina TaxID=508770 RepID=UPI001F093087|nr:amidohydrolase family protein [Sciscionella marina]